MWSTDENESLRVLAFFFILRIIKLDRRRYLEKSLQVSSKLIFFVNITKAQTLKVSFHFTISNYILLAGSIPFLDQLETVMIQVGTEAG